MPNRVRGEGENLESYLSPAAPHKVLPYTCVQIIFMKNMDQKLGQKCSTQCCQCSCVLGSTRAFYLLSSLIKGTRYTFLEIEVISAKENERVGGNYRNGIASWTLGHAPLV